MYYFVVVYYFGLAILVLANILGSKFWKQVLEIVIETSFGSKFWKYLVVTDLKCSAHFVLVYELQQTLSHFHDPKCCLNG